MKAATKLRRKIETLEKEKMSLLAEFEDLEKRAEARAGELENDVTTLRKEVKALEEILNVSEKSTKKR